MRKFIVLFVISAFFIFVISAFFIATGEKTQDATVLQKAFDANAEDTVYFAFGSYSLIDDAKEALDTQVKWLKNHEKVNVVVQGYCDEREDKEYNLALGERRANAIKSYMVANGIAADRVAIISYGNARPAVLGDNEVARAANRRAVTVVAPYN